MNSIRILALVLLASSLAEAGTITHHTFDSPTLGRDYAYNLYLPDDYDATATYPVVYLLHGSNGSEHDWPTNGNVLATADRLIAEGIMPPTVIVMPGTRSWWVDGFNEAAKSAFFDDLLVHVEATYAVTSERSGRFVAGLSAGGYGTVNFILEHPDMFAGAGAFSPAVYVPYPPESSSAYSHPAYLDANGNFSKELWERLNYPGLIEDYKAGDSVVPLYIVSGDHDTFDIAYHSAALYQALRNHQPRQIELRVVDGDHDWSVWAGSLPEVLAYLFASDRSEL